MLSRVLVLYLDKSVQSIGSVLGRCMDDVR
jgi:hypothetical protein